VLLPPTVHLEWRARLLRQIQVILRPHQEVPIRQESPPSHKPQPVPSGG
jgi:hypothetical protein